jgi:hypothetical protein
MSLSLSVIVVEGVGNAVTVTDNFGVDPSEVSNCFLNDVTQLAK